MATIALKAILWEVSLATNQRLQAVFSAIIMLILIPLAVSLAITLKATLWVVFSATRTKLTKRQVAYLATTPRPPTRPIPRRCRC